MSCAPSWFFSAKDGLFSVVTLCSHSLHFDRVLMCVSSVGINLANLTKSQNWRVFFNLFNEYSGNLSFINDKHSDVVFSERSVHVVRLVKCFKISDSMV